VVSASGKGGEAGAMVYTHALIMPREQLPARVGVG
jgi:hypothetical protein